MPNRVFRGDRVATASFSLSLFHPFTFKIWVNFMDFRCLKV
ncbi:hypothetical protein HMPREF9151_00126 [Hoylesella saccharolytica F0055]|uniref:Uncharacterized protein n=1 Tax=Hoylesella saccharolytica F0055 TaxID=1127699 RepID=L1NLD4_9BACT|nr:hypothetical protein HMPREF9151_00126 [Hoylesella saccharolytica F0055]